MSEPRLDDPQVEAALREVLAAPPFSQPHWDDALRRLVDWYNHSVGEWYLNDPVWFWSVLSVLSVLLGLLLWHLLSNLRSVWRALRREQPVTVGTAPASGGDLSMVRTLLARGEYRAAVEGCWTAVTGTWRSATAGAVTPRQQAANVAARVGESERQALRNLLSLHEAACYADDAVDGERARAALAHAEALVRAA